MSALLEARTLLRQLGLSGRRFTPEVLLERLDARLGIVIDAVPDVRLPAGGISGACITTNGSHVVFYPAGASNRQQLAVICHECAHLLLNHRGRSVEDVLTGTAPRRRLTNSPRKPSEPPWPTSRSSRSAGRHASRAHCRPAPRRKRPRSACAFVGTFGRPRGSDVRRRSLSRRRGATCGRRGGLAGGCQSCPPGRIRDCLRR